jgi:hypothetical protein
MTTPQATRIKWLYYNCANVHGVWVETEQNAEYPDFTPTHWELCQDHRKMRVVEAGTDVCRYLAITSDGCEVLSRTFDTLEDVAAFFEEEEAAIELWDLDEGCAVEFTITRKCHFPEEQHASA